MLRDTSVRGITRVAILLATLVGTAGDARAQGQTTPRDTARAAVSDTGGAPVVVDQDTLFRLYGNLGAFTPAERARGVAARIRRLAEDVVGRRDSIRLQSAETSTELIVGESVLMTVVAADAAPLGLSHQEVARMYATRIAQAIATTAERTSFQAILLGVVFTAVAVAVLIALLWGMRRVFPNLLALLERGRGTRIAALRIQRFEILSADRLTATLIGLVRIVRVALLVVIFYVFVTTVLGFFPWTRPLSRSIASYILTPLRDAWFAFLDYMPAVFFIAVIVVLTRYVIRFVRMFFTAIEHGTVEIPNFDRDWAMPTYKIARFLVIAFGLVVIFPYLPGAGSDAFKGVSIFLGALFTLGSSSAISNVVAGTLLTYTRAFRIGDRVTIGDTTGDVVERSLLVTRVRTIKNVDVTIPNALVLSTHTTNYTTMARQGGVILHTSVTIGYAAPWRLVHKALIAAARATHGIVEEPAPFVLQTSLDDFYVSYQINAYTGQPEVMARTYSDLHANIQDAFNEAGIEIMSPHYRAQRDGNQVAIPADALPADYVAPAFRVEKVDRKA